MAEKYRAFYENSLGFLKQLLTEHPLEPEDKQKLEEKINDVLKTLEKANTDLVMRHDLNLATKTMESNTHEIGKILEFMFACHSLLSQIWVSSSIPKKRPAGIPEKVDPKKQKLEQPEDEEYDIQLEQALALSLGM